MAENIHRARSAKLMVRCMGCDRSTRPGLLWLGGGDWVECPTCAGGKPGQMPVIVTEFKTPQQRSLITDSLIRQVQ